RLVLAAVASGGLLLGGKHAVMIGVEAVETLERVIDPLLLRHGPVAVFVGSGKEPRTVEMTVAAAREIVGRQVAVAVFVELFETGLGGIDRFLTRDLAVAIGVHCFEAIATSVLVRGIGGAGECHRAGDCCRAQKRFPHWEIFLSVEYPPTR